ncbi:snRNA-activating protein complex subunit 3 isoform X2 [Ooceraea biroi]|uniref:snRNA-activating protein complex subunit 3 isoform X2 n=1 Tax=Ooceraea biroi TaxID=2015173 RepID=UPI0005BB2D6C|nr:snRNA-activating protein complex subunit 3 isoform X2 [Ooceraea biroi]
MDKVYKFYGRHASPNIQLKHYFREYSESLESWARRDPAGSCEENIFRLMDADLSQARTHLMTHYCSTDHLTLPMEAANAEEREKHGYVRIPERILQNTSLETIKKYEDSRLSDNNATVIPNKDFLVYVKVYEPFKSQSSLNKLRTMNRFPVLKLRTVVSILGHQSLYELRQKILCQSDLSIATEVSENPNRTPGPMAKDTYKSGFFYIGDTFYNDTSVPINIDYSDVILKWAETRDVGSFKVETMDTRIDSLCVRFGFPWVYQHQGCCEHVIVLSDARLVTETDVPALSAYPKIERIRPMSGKNCIMCGMLNVRWILTDHDRIPHDTSYFCNKCFVSYNYVDGKKVGNFKAYNYPCITKLMPRRGSSD